MPASRPADSRTDTGTDTRTRVLVVGSGWHFLSGISYYTCRLSEALHAEYDVSVILMRRLLPARLYPGRERVGRALTRLGYPAGVPVFDGVDWWAVPSLVNALAFLRRHRPQVIVLQWWTGVVLHSYLALCLAARMLGIRVVVEFHEVQDTGEARRRWAARYVRAGIRPLLRRVDGVIVHSRFDREALREAYGLAGVPGEIALHGPYDQHGSAEQHGSIEQHRSAEQNGVPAPRVPAGAPGVCRLLFFGTIRPYKGLEDLVRAFAALGEGYRLTVVGETWEGWTLPAELIAASPARDRIEFVNRYVPDEEVGRHFAAADVVVLPYRRSSASGPLHIAMSHGLPVVVTAVGGLVEAAEAYTGTVFVGEGDPDALAAGIERAAGLTGRRHADPSSWQRTVEAYGRLLGRIGVGGQDIATSSNQTEPRFSPDLR